MVALGFEGANPSPTGRPSYHPAVMLKLYLYGYLNHIQSSRSLERECQRNVELMWLTGRLGVCFCSIQCNYQPIVEFGVLQYELPSS
jgi:transposase